MAAPNAVLDQKQPGLQAIGTLQPGEPPLGSADNPHSLDLFGGNLERIKSSFGDEPGITKMLEQQGFQYPHRNKDGEMVAYEPKSKQWFKDEQGLSHPLNWAAGHLGGALPTGGMAVGGVLGGSALGYPGAVAGAGAAGGAGEAARVGVGKMLGVNQGDFTPQVVNEAKNSALAESIGRPVAAGLAMIPGVKQAGAAVMKYPAKLAGKLSSLATFGAVDPEAATRLLMRPNQVLGSTKGQNVLDVAQAGAKELEGTEREMGSQISKARQAFADKYGANPVDTTHMTEAMQDAIERNRPNAYGQGPMEPEELEVLGGKQGVGSLDNGTGDATSSGSRNTSQTAGSLQKTADYMQQQAKGFYDKTGASKFKTDKGAGIAARTAGQIKGALHELSPELASADRQFSDYAGASNLMKGIENPQTAENFASNLFGKNKGAAQVAAQKYMPQTYERMADIGAFKSFGKDPLQALGPTAPIVGRLAMPAVGGSLAAHFSSNPLASLLGTVGGLGFAAGTSPLVHRVGLGIAGRAAQTEIPGMLLRKSPWLQMRGAQ
jgi:hypothetical protein